MSTRTKTHRCHCSLTVFHRNSNSMEISFHPPLDSLSLQILYMARHLSCASMCRNCCDLMTNSGITAMRSFHQIRIVSKNSLVKWAPAAIVHICRCFSWLSTTNITDTSWRHDRETPSALLAICEENPPVTGEFPSHKTSDTQSVS